MATKTTVLKGTPQSAATAQPYVAPAQPGRGYGVPLGPNPRTGKIVFIDPPHWREADEETGSEPVSNGLIGRVDGVREGGKSTFLKSLCIRLFGMQAGLDERGHPRQFRERVTSNRQEGGQDEYKLLNDAMRGKHFSPTDLGHINPFDIDMGDEISMLETAINLSESVIGHKLVRYQPLAHQVAMAAMHRKYEVTSPNILAAILSTQTLADVNEYYELHNRRLISKLEGQLKDKPRLLEQLQVLLGKPQVIPAAQFEEDSATMAASMNQLLHGDYGNLFGDEVSLSSLLSEPFVTIDQSQMSVKMRNIFDALMGKWMVWAMDNDRTDLIPHFNAGDEAQESYKSLMWLRFQDDFVRKARSYPTFDLRSTQYSSRLQELGDATSEERKLAETINLGVSIRFIGKQPDDDNVMQSLHHLGFSDYDAEMTKRYPQGRFALKLPGRKPVVFDHKLVPLEVPVIQSNIASKRMNERVNVWTLEEFRRRATSNGVETVKIGEE